MTALQYLRSIEWDYRTSRTAKSCLGCFAWHPDTPTEVGTVGHTSNCPLAAAIADAEKLEQYRGMRTRKEVEAELAEHGNEHTDRPYPADSYCAGGHDMLRWVLGL